MLKLRLLPNKPAKPKKQKNEKKAPFRISEQASEVGRLHMVVVDLQAKLQQSHKLNDVYLSQIKDLEDDNLSLCARMQELKVENEGNMRQFIQKNQKLTIQAAELVKVVAFLEEELEETKRDLVDGRVKMEQFREVAQVGKTAQLRASQLSAEVQRGKMKLLQSQRYWITRCQTLLAEQRAESERISLQKDGEFTMKVKMLRSELSIKEMQLQQKTKEIYKLIQHIQHLAD